MAKSRYDHGRSRTSLQRSSNSSKKTDKWEALKGWVTPNIDDDDIVSWSKARRQADEKAKERRSRRPNDIETYLGGITSHCHEIDDYLLFKSYSLLSTTPKPQPKKDLNKDTKSHDKVTLEAQGETTKDDSTNPERPPTVTTNEERPGTVKNTPRCASVNCPPEDDRKEDADTKDTKRPSSAAPHQQTQDSSEYKDNVENQTEKTQTEICSKPNPFRVMHRSKTEHQDTGKSIRLSYTQSNITLRSPYQSVDTTLESNHKHQPSVNPSVSTEETKPANGGIQTVSSLSQHSLGSQTQSATSLKDQGVGVANVAERTGVVVTSKHDFKDKVGSKSENDIAAPCHRPSANDLTLHSRSDHSVDSSLCKYIEPDNQMLSGLSVATLKSSSSPEKKVMSQKQVSLVLRNVTLNVSPETSQDGQRSFHSAPSRPLVDTAYEPEEFRRHDPSRGTMPIAELLPAVENNIKSRLNLVAKSKKEQTKEDLLQEILVPYEERTLITRDGTEMMRLKDRQHTILGPPAFKPVSNKTPLQRAKENTTKRLLGHQTGASYSEISRIRWGSSSGTLYTGNLAAKFTSEGDTRSAPVNGRLSKRKPTGVYHQVAPTTGPHQNGVSDVTGRINSRMMTLIRSKTSGVDFRFAVPD